MILKLLQLTLVSGLIWGTSEITLKATPEKENAITFQEAITLVDEEGFYNRAVASVASDGRIVVGDVGNKRILVYTKKGKQLHAFNIEGSGPGEVQEIIKVSAMDERIAVQSFMKISLFNYQGTFIKDIPVIGNGNVGNPIFNSDNITIQYTDSDYLFEVFDMNGEKKKAVKNEKYKAPENTGEDRMIISLRPAQMVATDQGYIQSKNGEYQFIELNSDFEKEKSITRPFDRIKRNFDHYKFNIEFDSSEESKKEQARMKAKMLAQLKHDLGEYEDDIQSVLGVYKGYIFLETSNEEKDVITIDVIDKQYNYYSKLSFSIEEADRNRHIENGKLIVSCKNENDGPYIKIFDINI